MQTFTTMLKELKTGISTLRKCKAEVVPVLLDDIKNTIERMTLHAKLLPMSYDLAGCKTFYPNKRKLTTPEIELSEIISLSHRLNKERNKEKYNGCVYVNICEDGKFYVGYTNKVVGQDTSTTVISRLEQHRDNGGGTYWTYFYPVISCMTFFPGNCEDEDLMTILMSKCVGIGKVRGGKWASAMTIPKLPDMTVQEIVSKLLNK